MFPETDGISDIISDTIKVVFQRRLVDRVLKLWTEKAHGQRFPRRDQIEPSMLGGLGELPRDRHAIACPVFIFRPRWEKLVIHTQSRRKSGRRSPATSAGGPLGRPLSDDRGARDASWKWRPISGRSLSTVLRW